MKTLQSTEVTTVLGAAMARLLGAHDAILESQDATDPDSGLRLLLKATGHLAASVNNLVIARDLAEQQQVQPREASPALPNFYARLFIDSLLEKGLLMPCAAIDTVVYDWRWDGGSTFFVRLRQLAETTREAIVKLRTATDTTLGNLEDTQPTFWSVVDDSGVPWEALYLQSLAHTQGLLAYWGAADLVLREIHRLQNGKASLLEDIPSEASEET